MRFLSRYPRGYGVVKHSVLWAALSLLPNLLWEVGQLPLYTLINEPNPARLAYAVVHCTLGDVAIAAISYALTSAMLGDTHWPAQHPWRGVAIVTALGLAFTVFSEWHNVYQAGAWAYSPSMPLIAGIGLSPLLQWLLLPAVTLVPMRLLQLRSWPPQARPHGTAATRNREVMGP